MNGNLGVVLSVYIRVMQKTQIIQYDDQGKSLYTSGMLDKFIEEKKNRDICLADCDAGAVTVHLKLLLTARLTFSFPIPS